MEVWFIACTFDFYHLIFMNNDSLTEMINKMIMEAEGKFQGAIKSGADQNAVREIKQLIVYLREREKDINKTHDTEK